LFRAGSFWCAESLLECLIFLLLTATNVREAIIHCLPMNLTRAIANGIAAGVLSWLVFQTLGGHALLVSPVAWGVGVFFVLKFVV